MIRKILKLVITALKHKEIITTAKEIWFMVDENFRITEKVEEKIKTKAEQFDEYLKTKYPELQSQEIQEIRQTIAGEINKDKDPAVSTDIVIADLKSKIDILTKENTELKGQLNKVQVVVTPVQETSNTEQS